MRSGGFVGSAAGSLGLGCASCLEGLSPPAVQASAASKRMVIVSRRSLTVPNRVVRDRSVEFSDQIVARRHGEGMTHPDPTQAVIHPSAAFYIRPVGKDGPHDVHACLRGQLTRQGKDWKFEGEADLFRYPKGLLQRSACLIRYSHDQWLDIEFIDQPVRIPSSAWMTEDRVEIYQTSKMIGFKLRKPVAFSPPGGARQINSGSSFILRV